MNTHKEESGTAIFVVMMIVAILMVIVGAMAAYTTTINRHVQRSDTLGSAMAIGDGCIDHIFAYWRQACRKPSTPIPTTNDLASLTLPTSAEFPNVPNFTVTPNNYDDTSPTTVQQCKVIAVDPEWNPMPSASPPTSNVGQQATTQTYNYIATAYVTLPTLSGTTANNGAVVAKVQRIFQKEQISPWNWAIFYIDPLEIHPGPDFYVTGWVHTNSNLYTAHKTLHFMDKATYGGDWSIDFAPGDPRKGSETPTSPTWPANMPPALDVQHEPFGIDSASVFSTTDSNHNNDGFHEFIEPPDGVASDTDPLGSQPNQRYFLQPGAVLISIDNSNNVTIGTPKLDGNGVPTGAVQPYDQSVPAQKALYDMFNGAVKPNDATIQDNREAASVRLATLDVSKLISGSSWKAAGFNGVVYINDTSAASSGGDPTKTPDVTKRRGIRIKNGSFLPTGGLTVASGNPVFIQGDFNTGGVSPPSNSGDPTKPDGSTSGGSARRPSSVVADAVYILSNAWSDSNGFLGLGSRVASNTTVHTAIISGIVPTNYNNNGKYSGGAENFPRFNEDWTNKTLTYYGSMVELYTSQEATGPWGNGNVYGAPTRQWYFDNNFKTSTPPGSMMIYNYIKGKWSLM